MMANSPGPVIIILITDLSKVTYSSYPNGRISGMTIITTDITGQSAPDTVTYSYQYECQLLSLPPDWK